MCRYDANVDVADRWGGTALTAALRHGHLAIAKMLMSCEAKLGSHAGPDLLQVTYSTPSLACSNVNRKAVAFVCLAYMLACES